MPYVNFGCHSYTSMKYLVLTLGFIDRKTECGTCINKTIRKDKHLSLIFTTLYLFFSIEKNRLHVEFHWSGIDNLEKFNQLEDKLGVSSEPFDCSAPVKLLITNSVYGWGVYNINIRYILVVIY